jgi:hypothetical protein
MTLREPFDSLDQNVDSAPGDFGGWGSSLFGGSLSMVRQISAR